ncbi:MAG: inorganic phosphate transporter [Bacteroidales bacterium]|nr:inorganic phosphate transporter [Bacteroidales bacterium]
MIVLFFLSSGLFLGWSLGANDAANIFGTAVGTRMIRFKTAAIVASIFVILGAVIQGAGANETLGELGSVSTLAAAFTVALSAAFTVYWMTRLSLPVSTSQAIVGAIIGWNLYTSNPTDLSTLSKIITTWISGPILGGLFAIPLYILVRYLAKKTKTHILILDAYTKYGLLLVGAFGAYSLGANNIANVMGVFTSSVNLPEIDLWVIQISSTRQLFFIGGVAIAVGIFTYSKHVMQTVGNTLMPLTPEAAFVVVLSQSLVLFVFSSQGLSDALVSVGLPAIPLVPVSSSQVVIGAIIGIGIYKGGKQIKFNILGSISLGWIATPLVAGMIAFFMLFFVNNVFQQDVGGDRQLTEVSERFENGFELDESHTIFPDKLADTTESETPGLSANQGNLNPIDENNRSIHIYYLLILTLFIATIAALIIWIRKLKKRLTLVTFQNEAKENNYQLKIERLAKSLDNKMHLQEDLSRELKFRQGEMITMAMSILRKNEFLNELKEEVVKIKSNVKEQETRLGLNKLSLMITQDLSLDRDREKFQMNINEQHSNFIHKLSEAFPSMTDNEKRLASMLRLNLSSKEIASILNISTKSVEMNRYRLRKKLKVEPKISLSDFIRDF